MRNYPVTYSWGQKGSWGQRGKAKGLRYLSSLSGQRTPRPDDRAGNTPSRCVVGDLLLGLLRKVRMIPQVLEVLGKLTVPVRDVRGIEEVIVEKLLDAPDKTKRASGYL
jgi:hypothetical protein